MAVIQDADPFVIELQTGEVLVVAEPDPELVQAVELSIVEIQTDSVSIIEETPADEFIVESEFDSITVVRDPEQLVVEVSAPGPQGPPGTGTGGGVPQTNTTVAPSATVTADALAVVDFEASKWLVSIIDSSASERMWYEVGAIHDGSQAQFVEYGVTGDQIDVDTDVDVSAGQMRLRITNNTVNSLDVKVLRIATEV